MNLFSLPSLPEKASVDLRPAAAGKRGAKFPALFQNVLRKRALADDRGIDFFQAKFFQLSVLYDLRIYYMPTGRPSLSRSRNF